MLKLKLFFLQKKLNRMTKKGGAFDSGKLLAVSQQLDEVINEYYKHHPALKLHRPPWWNKPSCSIHK